MVRKVILFSLALYTSLFLLPRFCYKRTGDFWFQTILSDRNRDPSLATPPPTQLGEINALLSQRFFFLSGGMQCIAFLGEDGKTILKFFKHRPSLLKKGRFRWHVPFLDPIIESYKIAYTKLKEETALIYAHLNKTKNLHPSVRLVDKQHITFDISLDETEFVIQRRTELLCTRLRRQMNAHDISGAKGSLQSLFATVKTLYASGINNTDRAFRRNVGFIGEKAVLLDAGSLCLEERPKTSLEIKMDVLQKGKNLEKWLKKHYPELNNYYYELMQNLGGK